ncbi:hypothetical protein LOK49_LG03G02053 [Camellia lanceoleosa]|uniref:Uncharacterized protein n=1 Tax=Camellia lanceoleosa TaxID=1840588 RepID=A0ACC0IA86_9ERIC|nr:hypothetical protein LOK49_LG03G02053 [Camellia lanceoleosa]
MRLSVLHMLGTGVVHTSPGLGNNVLPVFPKGDMLNAHPRTPAGKKTSGKRLEKSLNQFYLLGEVGENVELDLTDLANQESELDGLSSSLLPNNAYEEIASLHALKMNKGKGRGKGPSGRGEVVQN